MPHETNWEVHRRDGAKRIAVKETHWRKPMYLLPETAFDLMMQIAECLGVEPPEVAMRPRCESTIAIASESFQCMADAVYHEHGRHYWKGEDFSVTWREDD